MYINMCQTVSIQQLGICNATVNLQNNASMLCMLHDNLRFSAIFAFFATKSMLITSSTQLISCHRYVGYS